MTYRANCTYVEMSICGFMDFAETDRLPAQSDIGHFQTTRSTPLSNVMCRGLKELPSTTRGLMMRSIRK